MRLLCGKVRDNKTCYIAFFLVLVICLVYYTANMGFYSAMIEKSMGKDSVKTVSQSDLKYDKERDSQSHPLYEINVKDVKQPEVKVEDKGENEPEVKVNVKEKIESEVKIDDKQPEVKVDDKVEKQSEVKVEEKVDKQPEVKVQDNEAEVKLEKEVEKQEDFKVDDGVDLDEKVKLFAKEVRRRLSLIQSEVDYRPPNQTCVEGKNTPLCFAENCPNAPFKLTVEERVRKLLTFPALSLSSQQMENVLSIAKDVPENDIIIATASSSNHYNEMQALFKNLDTEVFPLVKNASVVVFDLGLTATERAETEAKCRCKVLSFPFKQFPEHVKNLNCFSWKALIIRAVLPKARQILIYQDTSVRWNHHLPEALTRASEIGQVIFSAKYEPSTVYRTIAEALITKSRSALIYQDTSVRWNSRLPEAIERAKEIGQVIFSQKSTPSCTYRTIQEMYKYFEEDPCSYRSFRENLGGVQIMKNDQVIIEALLNQWARCALEKSCICPRPIRQVLSCHGLKLHGCHRSDQSAMSMLVGKLYGADSYKLVPPPPVYPMSVHRGSSDPKYFKSRKV